MGDSRRHERPPRLDAQQRALLAALVVSLLAHHTVLSVLPAPRAKIEKRPRPVEVALYERATPAPVSAAAAPAVPPSVPPPLAAVAPPETPPPADETPAERAERLRRDLEELQPPRIAQRPPRPIPPREPEPQPPEPEPEEEPVRPRPAPDVQAINMHFVQLPPRTDEPETVPDQARFFAQRTQDVEEETRAAVTTLRDEEEAETARAGARPDEAPAPIDGVRDGQPQVDEREGSDEPDRQAANAAAPRPARPERRAGSAAGERGDPRETLPETSPRPEARPGGERGTGAAEPLVAAAGVRAPDRPEGTLAAEERAETRPGTPGDQPPVPGGPPVEPTPALAAAGAGGQQGAGGSGGAAGADTATAPADLTLDWTTFEELFHEQLDRERQAFLERRRERRRMGGAMDRMDRATAQLENFNPDVRPGNQTALDTLYHPFALYLTAFHRKLHPQWGDGFLVSLLRFPDDHPLNDMTLWVKLEIVVNGDGTIHKITVVRSSGNTVYDVAAIDAVFQGEPYPPPPPELQSGDGRLYMRYAFYRNHSQCGVWNAEPYILPDPPSLHEPGEAPDTEHPTPGEGATWFPGEPTQAGLYRRTKCRFS